MATTIKSILVLALVCASSTDAAANPLLIRQADATSSDRLDCTTEFSGDYYGFGVRLGVYFAWLSSYCANTLLPSEISGALDTNSIFLLALLVSLFKGSHMHEIYQIDGLVLMHLCSGFLFSSFSIWGYRTKHYCREGPHGIRHFGRFGTHFRLVLTTAIAAYGCWFWWEGVDDGLQQATKPGCAQVYTWLFGKWKIDGGVHILYIIMSGSTTVYYGGMCVAALAALCLKLSKLGRRQQLNKKFETGLSAAELKLIFTFNRIWNFFWMITCAIIIELTLSQNHMIGSLARNHDIAFPSQLLPLIVGALSFIRVCFLIYAEARDKHDRKHECCDGDEGDEGDEHEAQGWGEGSTPPAPKANRQSLGLHIRNVFAPNLGYRSSELSPYPTQSPKQAPKPHVMRPWHHRYTVSWLPWLSLFPFWHHHAIADVETALAQPDIAAADTSPTDAAPEINEKDGIGIDVTEDAEVVG